MSNRFGEHSRTISGDSDSDRVTVKAAMLTLWRGKRLLPGIYLWSGHGRQVPHTDQLVRSAGDYERVVGREPQRIDRAAVGLQNVYHVAPFEIPDADGAVCGP